MVALRKIGVPYTDADIANAQKNLADQAAKIVTNLKVGSINNVPPDREILAVIAYLQRLGTDIKAQPTPAPVAVAK